MRWHSRSLGPLAAAPGPPAGERGGETELEEEETVGRRAKLREWQA